MLSCKVVYGELPFRISGCVGAQHMVYSSSTWQKKQYVDLHRRQDGDIEVEELDKVWCCRVP